MATASRAQRLSLSWLPPPGVWELRPDDVALLDNDSRYLPSALELQAPPLQIPSENANINQPVGQEGGAYGGAEADEPASVLLQLSVHQVHPLVNAKSKRPGAPQEDGQAASSSSEQPTAQSVDAVGFTGGPVWCADFCPPPWGAPLVPNDPPFVSAANSTNTGSQASGSGSGRVQPSSASAAATSAAAAAVHEEFVALGCHNKDHVTNRIGSLVSGPGVVQVWAVPHSPSTPNCPEVRGEGKRVRMGRGTCEGPVGLGLTVRGAAWAPGPGPTWSGPG